DFASGVARRKLQIDDDRILRILRIELAECLSGDLLVLPHTGPRVAAESRRFFHVDLNLRHLRVGLYSREYRSGSDQDGCKSFWRHLSRDVIRISRQRQTSTISKTPVTMRAPDQIQS